MSMLEVLFLSLLFQTHVATKVIGATITARGYDVETSQLVNHINVIAGTGGESNLPSRGNTIPIVARPWGFNHWSVQTEGRATSWWFQPDSTQFYGIRCTHQPSPWIGDYSHFTVLPTIGGHPQAQLLGTPSFKPHLLETQLQIGQATADFNLAPSMHGAALKVKFPKGSQGALKFSLPGPGEWTVSSAGLSTSEEEGLGLTDGRDYVRMFVAVETPAATGAKWQATEGLATLEFPASEQDQTYTVRLATSFVSPEQAWTSLRRELAGKTFEDIQGEAHDEWVQLLSRAQVKFPDTQRSKVFYTNLYRSMLFPRFLAEETADGDIVHRSAYSKQVVSGQGVTDEGMWDAYHTHYPLLSLLFPDKLGKIIAGWTNAYKEAGWLPTWSSFSQRRCMVGTMGDCALADAIVKKSQGLLEGFDSKLAFEAIMKDATVAPDNRALENKLGRAGLQGYITKGFAPADDPGIDHAGAGKETAALTLNYNVADACIAEAASALGHHQEADLLRNRSRSYKAIFDPKTKYFRAKRSTGSWAFLDMNSHTWGNGFTEGSMAHYRFAAAHDVSGLVELYGGQTSFCEAVHQMFAGDGSSEPGSYGSVIHEMDEAQQIGQKGFGKYAHNNQPVHEALYVAAAAGCRPVAESNIRRVMKELYSSEGWSGDEDTGEMSSWYVLSSLGLYSLLPGSDDLVLGSPEVSRADIKVPGRPDLTIEAPENSEEKVFVEGVSFNSRKLEGSVRYTDLARKGGKLLFSMTSTLSDDRQERHLHDEAMKLDKEETGLFLLEAKETR